jgi:hypothetical protein
MKIITTSGIKTFNVIPRQFISGTVDVLLIDNETGRSFKNTPTAETVGNYMTFTVAFSTLTEGKFYTFEVNINPNGANLYKDKVFCTDQTINQATNNYYSVNDGEYTTENSFDNDYIIL